MTTFNEKIEGYCREICKELDIDPDAGEGGIFLAWTEFEGMVRDWLATEAFTKVKQRYWITEI